MIPKEKAKELFWEFFHIVNKREAKQCAIIAVDKILIELTNIPYGIDYINRRDYWQEVKQEIEKI
jgi:hypothetical protein